MTCPPSLCSLDISSATAIAGAVTADFIDAGGPAGDCGGSAIPMGLGALGNGAVIFKRKFRWTFEISYCCGSGSPLQVASAFCKTGSRPHFSIDEVEINFLNGVTWIPGKGKWQTINVTFYDVAGASAASTSAGLLGWLASCYDFTDPVCLTMGSKTQDYTGEARITLYDGCGVPLEAWLLQQVWPTDVDFGDLDMGSNDECDITLTLRYTNVCYQSFCPSTPIQKCPCSPCT